MSGPASIPADFAELVRACALASIKRTARRSPAAAEHARAELEDITQAAALEALERIARGDAAGMDLTQLCSRSAAAVIMRAYRAETRRRAAEAPQEPRSSADDTRPQPTPEPHAGPAERPTEDAATAAELIEDISEHLPPSLRRDAPRILYSIAAGATTAEAAHAAGISLRQAQRITQAARKAAERI